jgi:hypothetical protein
MVCMDVVGENADLNRKSGTLHLFQIKDLRITKFESDSMGQIPFKGVSNKNQSGYIHKI